MFYVDFLHAVCDFSDFKKAGGVRGCIFSTPRYRKLVKSLELEYLNYNALPLVICDYLSSNPCIYDINNPIIENGVFISEYDHGCIVRREIIYSRPLISDNCFFFKNFLFSCNELMEV